MHKHKPLALLLFNLLLLLYVNNTNKRQTGKNTYTKNWNNKRQNRRKKQRWLTKKVCGVAAENLFSSGELCDTVCSRCACVFMPCAQNHYIFAVMMNIYAPRYNARHALCKCMLDGEHLLLIHAEWTPFIFTMFRFALRFHQLSCYRRDKIKDSRARHTIHTQLYNARAQCLFRFVFYFTIYFNLAFKLICWINWKRFWFGWYALFSLCCQKWAVFLKWWRRQR